MSAFALLAESSPLSLDRLDALLDVVADRGETVGRLRLLDHAAVGWRVATPLESPPLVDEDDVALACLGWVADPPSGGWTDAARRIVTGDLRPVAELRGAWTIVAANRRSGELVIIVDPLGLGVVHARRSGTHLMLATEVSQLLTGGGVSTDLNWGLLAERLAQRPTSLGETPYREIELMKPGRAWRWTAGDEIVEDTWWNWGDRVAKRSDTVTSEEVRSALELAVQRCVRAATKPGLLLSGGLDSSVLAGVATELGAKPTALLLRYQDYGCDESVYQDAVVQRHRMDVLDGTVQPLDPVVDLIAPTERYLQPVYCPNTDAGPLVRLASTEGVDAVLTGLGGDELFLAWPPRVLDLVAGRRLRDAFTLARQRAEASGWRSAALMTGREAWFDVVPRRLISARRRRSRPWGLVTDDLAWRERLDWRCAPAPLGLGPRALVADRIRDLVGTGWVSLDRVLGDLEQASTRVAYRFPYRDLDLIASVICLPETTRGSASDNRAFQRTVFSDVLPDVVIDRRGKAAFDGPLAVQLAHPWVEELLRTSWLARQNIIDQQGLLAIYGAIRQQLREGCITTSGTIELWTVAGIEILARRQAGESLPLC